MEMTMTHGKAIVLLASILFVAGARVRAEIVNNNEPSIPEICSLMPRGVTILRPNSCTHWIRCASAADATDFEEGACLIGLYYNKDNGRCQYEDDVQCPYGNLMVKNRCEKNVNGAFLPDGDSCNGYIFCKDGREMRSTCPKDLLFDPSQRACVYPTDYTCPLAVEKTPTSPICRSVASGKYFANELYCTKYHECVEGALLTHDCGKDMAFDHIMGRCVQKEGVVCVPTAKELSPESTVCGTASEPRVGYFSDEVSCAGYYVCAQQADGSADLEPKHLHCDGGYFFDVELWSCRDRVNVRCDLNRCEGMGNKYVNIPGDCTTYARCNKGIAVSQGKCPNNYFFDERTQGCTPQNISYVACAV